jgi:hypothetical protein
MDLKAVESSNIAAMGHDGETQKMQVKFKTGTVYLYRNVTAEVFEQVINAASIGRMFNQLIKSKPNAYPYEQVA